jgi:hypothetical protein
MVEGSDEFIQLEALLSQVTLAGIKQWKSFGFSSLKIRNFERIKKRNLFRTSYS